MSPSRTSGPVRSTPAFGVVTSARCPNHATGGDCKTGSSRSTTVNSSPVTESVTYARPSTTPSTVVSWPRFSERRTNPFECERDRVADRCGRGWDADRCGGDAEQREGRAGPSDQSCASSKPESNRVHRELGGSCKQQPPTTSAAGRIVRYCPSLSRSPLLPNPSPTRRIVRNTQRTLVAVTSHAGSASPAASADPTDRAASNVCKRKKTLMIPMTAVKTSQKS